MPLTISPTGYRTFTLGPWTADNRTFDETFTLTHYGHIVGEGFPSITAAMASTVGPFDTPQAFRSFVGPDFVIPAHVA